MSLKGFLPGEDPVADGALNTAGGLSTFDNERIYGIGPRTTSFGFTASRVRAFTGIAATTATGTTQLHFTHIFSPVPRVQRIIRHRGAPREGHTTYRTVRMPFWR